MRRRAWAWGALALALVLVLALALARAGDEGHRVLVEPSVAPTARPMVRIPTLPGPPAPSTRLTIRLRVPLSDPATFRPVTADAGTHQPWTYWPGRDEADWPDLATTDQMELLLARLRGEPYDGTFDEALSPFVEAAYADGLLPLPPEGFDDPWTAVMAAQAAYAELFLVEPEDLAAAYAQVAARHRLAGQVVAAWPDHPASDLATLILANGATLLDTAASEGISVPSDGAATAEVLDLVVRLLERSDDAALTGEATRWLATSGEAEVLDAVRAADDGSSPRVALGALGIAVRAGRWDEALAWADTLEALPQHDRDVAAWARAAAELAGHHTADDWRGALFAEAMRCAGPDTGDEEVVFDVVAGVWSARSPATPFAACLAGYTAPEGSLPTAGSQGEPADAEVTVEVVRSTP